MSNSAEPQISAVDDPSEPEVVSKAADKAPENPATADLVRVNEEAARRNREMSYSGWRSSRVKNYPHPTYYKMIVEALVALKKRTGSSIYAITKYMKDKYQDNLPYDYHKKTVDLLKESVKNGRLITIKASYKLTKAGKMAAAKPKPKAKPKSKAAKAKPAEAKPKPKPAKTKATEAKPKPKARAKAAEEKPKAKAKGKAKAAEEKKAKAVIKAPEKKKKATPAKEAKAVIKAPEKKKATPAKKAEKSKAPAPVKKAPAKKKAKKGSA